MMIPNSRFHPLRWLMAIGILSLLCTFNASADDQSSGIDRMVRQIEELFPTMEGYVLSVKGNRVAIDLKQGQDIKAGQTLNLIRFGDPITHPVTKAIIGREETDLGQIQVTDVRKNYSLAKVITPGVTATKGDGVRSAFKKIKIVVAPVMKDASVAGNTETLGLEIESRLNHRARFEVPAFDLGVWLLEHKVTADALTSPANIKRLSQSVRADYLLLTGVQTLQGKTVLKYRLVSSSDGRVVKTARVLIGSLPTAPPPMNNEQGVQTDLRPGGKDLLRFIGKQEFDFEVVDFAVGDLTGKGHKDFVLIDPHRVLIYRYRKGQFKKLGQYVLKEGVHKLLSVDVADINGNGRDEIFVTNSLGDRLRSFVLEAIPGEKGLIPILEDVNRYFRVLRDFEGPPMLVTQSPGFEQSFEPRVHRVRQMHFKKGEYQVGEELPIQTGENNYTTLYGLSYGHLGTGETLETIFLDNNYHLRVYSSGGRLLVNSDEYFGHDPRIIEVGFQEVIGGKPKIASAPESARFKGRVQLVQHNARKYVLVPKNHRQGSFLSKLVIVKNSSLVVFGLHSGGLKKLSETKKQLGYLAGYQAVDVAPGHKRVHAVTVADQGGVLSNKKISTIYTYDWGQ